MTGLTCVASGTLVSIMFVVWQTGQVPHDLVALVASIAGFLVRDAFAIGQEANWRKQRRASRRQPKRSPPGGEQN